MPRLHARPESDDDAPHHNAEALIQIFLRRASNIDDHSIHAPTAHPGSGQTYYAGADRLRAPGTDIAGYLSPDVAATAIQMAQHFVRFPGLLEHIRDRRTTGAIWIANPERHRCVLHVLERCVFESSVTMTCDSDFHFHETNQGVVTFSRTAGDNICHTSQDGLKVSYATERELSVIGIASERDDLLPPELVWRTDWDMKLGEVDISVLNHVVNAITGYQLIDVIDPELARSAELNARAFPIEIASSDTRAQDIQRSIILNLDSLTIDGPRLEQIAGYGSARQWGLNLATDLAFYRNGDLDWDTIEDIKLRLHAEDGVGKRLFLRALSRSARVPVITVDCLPWCDINSVSGVLKEMSAAFAKADRLAPSILVLEEFELFLPEKWELEIRSQLLHNLKRSYEVVLIVSEAVPDPFRPHRDGTVTFSKDIRLEFPGSNDLIEIFRYYLKDDLVDVDISRLAIAGRNRLGVDVKRWVQNARAKAARAGRPLCLDDILGQIRFKLPTS